MRRLPRSRSARHSIPGSRALRWCASIESRWRRTRSSPRRAGSVAGDDHDISRRLACAVAKRGWRVELHGEAVVVTEAVGHAAERHLDAALLDPDLLMKARLACAGFVGHARARRQYDLDDLNGR